MRPQKILMAHNYYQIHGGEEESFKSEMSMLMDGGQEVITYVRDNAQILSEGIWNKIELLTNTIWSKESYAAITDLIRRNRPQIAHFQNTFPLISPSVYHACKKECVPVVQSLRNYRLICPNGFFFRQGRVCEDCLGRFVPWPGIIHSCYRDSKIQTAAVASMLAYHRAVKTWESQVDLYIALTEFSRNKFVESGLPAERIVVKPNYIPDPGMGEKTGKYVVYVGRLSPEKGINVLLDAWKHLPHIPLKIVGEGPLLSMVDQFIQENRMNVTLLGRLPNDQAMDVIKKSAFLIFPSIWYETFGRTIVEAFACGKPVIASRHGTAVELIQERVSGLFFDPGNSPDLIVKTSALWDSPSLMDSMSRNAREVYEEKYTRARNYRQLIEIYERAMDHAG